MTSDCRCCVCSTCPFHGLCLAEVSLFITQTTAKSGKVGRRHRIHLRSI